ncbi:MAG TPA: tetratricopeptide repeat protein [Chitinophagaceae bacterium]|nr:tetratricopeptide repeat protein [Chitinophagaceae bacterium]
MAKSYLRDFDVKEQIDWLQQLYPNSGTSTIKDSLPLTMHAERIVRHAGYLAFLKKKLHTNSVHLLLSMLSYDNTVSERVKKKGIIFEDIAGNLEGGLPKTPVEIKLRHFRKPSVISRFFRPGSSMRKLSEEVLEHAQNLWTYQQYDDCITTCQTGLELIPAHQELKILLALSFLKKRDHTTAAGHLEELVRTFPDDPGFQLSLSYCYDNMGDYLKAGEMLDSMLAKDPDHDIVLNNKGFCLLLQARYAEAVPFFEKAIQINPLFAYPWDNLGFVKYKLGDTGQALILIDKALELDKGNSYAYKYKGIIFMEQDNKTLAMENFQLALKYGYTKTYGDEVLQLIEKCK